MNVDTLPDFPYHQESTNNWTSDVYWCDISEAVNETPYGWIPTHLFPYETTWPIPSRMKSQRNRRTVFNGRRMFIK